MEKMKYTYPTFERFSLPRLNENTINRKEIIKQFDNLSKHGILFISAPAGYGKTSVAVLWSTGKNVAWISLDEYSSSPADIYKSILYVLSCKIPEEFYNAPLECMLDLLEKSTNWPDAIIIDDYHLCADLSVARALPLIRARMPITTSFILLSRNSPTDILDEQIVKGKIKQITGLKFTCDEIVRLFNKRNIHISKLEAELLHKHTDGWATALEVILMTYTGQISDMFNQKILYRYLKSYVFDSYDNFHILEKCSICESLNPKLCETITGQRGTWEIITSLAKKTGLVTRLDDNTYCFHDLLKEFLFSEMQLDEIIDKPLLYKTAANWYKENGDILHAIVLAAKSGDITLTEDYLRLSVSNYGKYDVEIVAYFLAVVENIYPKIPVSIAKQSLRLSLAYYSALFYLGRLPESYEWLDNIKELLTAHEHHQDDIIAAANAFASDPRKKTSDIVIIYKNILPFLKNAKIEKKTRAVTLTVNMPFYHRGIIDKTDISAVFDEFLSKGWKYLSPLMNSPREPLLPLLLEAGIYYERGDLVKAEEIAEKAVQISENFPPELRFSSLTLYAEILRVQGKAFDLAHISSMISETKAHYLSPNFTAYTAYAKLLDGDTEVAATWLMRANIESTLKFYKIYQYFTTARALMVTDKMSEAVSLLERLTMFSQDYRRSSDYIEALTLQAICEWHMKQTNDAIKTIIPAIIKATELKLVMLIVKEGRNVLPILQKILSRLKYGYDVDILDKAFVNTLFLKAKAISQYSRGLFLQSKVKPIKLSQRQKEVLVYLCENLSYCEISEKTGIKISTVNYHIRKIYGKLGVSNARDAVMKASKLGIGL